MFASEFKDETGKSVYTEFNFDVSEYTYVVCYGYNLKKLTFSKANVSGSFSNPTYYYGKAYLEKNENPNVVNIYMIRKISIENDPHSNTDEFTVVLQ